jgi:hypothetical protein
VEVPESRRKARYLMAIHEQLPRVRKVELQQVGWRSNQLRDKWTQCQHGNGVADSLPLGSGDLDVQLGRRLPVARPPRCLFHVALVNPGQLSVNEVPVL